MTTTRADQARRTETDDHTATDLRTGYILVSDDEIPTDDSLVGTCAEFPSGRVSAEIDEEYAADLPSGRHPNWSSQTEALDELEAATGAEFMWIDWSG